MKIIGSDYDGTLNHNGIDDRKRRAIAQWRKAGNAFCLVSGRHARNVRELHLEQNFECDYFVGSNGAVILNAQNEAVYTECCDPRLLVPLIGYLFELGCHGCVVHSVNYFGVFPTEEAGRALNRDNRYECYTLQTIPSIPYYTQVSTWHSTEEAAAMVAAKVRQQFGERFHSMQNGLSVDIVHIEVNKANGLSRLVELLGASDNDVITVGDNVNDYDMIKAFRSYAMENGVDTIKTLADFTTPGVAELIEKELALP